MNQPPPGPKGKWLTGSLPDFRADPLAFFLTMQETYGDVVSIQLATTPSVLITHPNDVQRVLRTNRNNYSKDTRGIHRMREFLGDGLLTIIDEDRWRKNRRTMQPVFRPRAIHQFVEDISSLTADMLQDWSGVVQGAPEMTKLTMGIAGRCFFGTDFDGTAVLERAFFNVMQVNQNRFRRAINSPLWWPSSENRLFGRAIRELDGFLEGLIRERREQPENGDDLLSMLIESRDEETHEGMDDAQLRDEAITLLGAGHETTANALALTLDLLARCPEIWSRVREEALAAWGDGGPTMDALDRLPFTTACINEGMRLNPPAWVFGRLAVEEDVLGGCVVPAGTLVMMSPFVTHRRPDVWDDPLSFRPERFLDTETDRHPFSFYPFSGGGRSCIGMRFAMMEMQIVVAMIARRCERLERVNPEVVGWNPLLTLRPKDEVPLRVE